MDLVHQDGTRLFVTSLDISNRFGKRHNDVLRAIEALECSAEFRLRNFAQTVYHRPNPSGGKGIPTPKYEITRDGFVFLCMGFTGQQAALWKERYIEAFNQMEAALRGPRPAAPANHLALAQEIGTLKNALASQQQTIIKLYQRVDTAQRGQIRAIGIVERIYRRQAARDAKELVLLLEAQGVPRDIIAIRTGKTHNHIRQIVWQAKRDGGLRQSATQEPSPQGELKLGEQA